MPASLLRTWGMVRGIPPALALEIRDFFLSSASIGEQERFQQWYTCCLPAAPRYNALPAPALAPSKQLKPLSLSLKSADTAKLSSRVWQAQEKKRGNVTRAQIHAVRSKTRDPTSGLLLPTRAVLLAVAQKNRIVQANQYMTVGAYRKCEPLLISERNVTLDSSLASQPRGDQQCKQRKNNVIEFERKCGKWVLM